MLIFRTFYTIMAWDYIYSTYKYVRYSFMILYSVDIWWAHLILFFDIDGNLTMIIYCLTEEDYRSVVCYVGRDHEHLDSCATDWGLLPDPEDERDDVPHLEARGAPEEPGGVRQHGLPRTAHIRVCAGGSWGGCDADL